MQEKGQKCKNPDVNLYTKKQAIIACLSIFLLKFLISNVLFPYKRFITQTVLSNSSYYDGNFDVELHPAFDTLFRLSQASEQQNSTIELAETQAGIKKEPTNKALNLNGGADASRFELLVVSYMKHLLTPNTYKICNLIEKLCVVM